MKTKQITAAGILLILCLMSSCHPFKEEPISYTALKLNTVVKVTIYDSVDPSLAKEAVALCDDYDNLFSRTNENSEIYKLNHSLLPTDADGYATVSPETFELLSIGVKYGSLSNDSFTIAIEPLTSLWDFSSGSCTIPDHNEILSVLPYLSTNRILFREPCQIRLADTNTGVDLGGIAKGYIADKIAVFLKNHHVENAIINLGGNVLVMGNKGNQPFTIGIQKPFASQGEYLASLQVSDKSIVSSGIYERYFEKDNILYHHILNPHTGYPYDNGLIGVTIITDSSTDADALSTTCFSLGLDEGMALVEDMDNVDAMFIDSNNQLHFSSKFEEKYHPVLNQY